MVAYTDFNTVFLFTNQTTDANSTPYSVNYPNKVAILKVWGTFDGGVVKFQTLAPQTVSPVWIDVPDIGGINVSLTENGQRVIEYIVQNEQIRAVLSGSGASTTVNVSLELC